MSAKKHKNAQFMEEKIDPSHTQGGEKNGLLEERSVECSNADRTYEKRE